MTSLNSLTRKQSSLQIELKYVSVFSLIAELQIFKKQSMNFCVQGLKLLKQPKNQISFHRHFNFHV